MNVGYFNIRGTLTVAILKMQILQYTNVNVSMRINRHQLEL